MSASASHSGATTPPAADPWLHGRTADLLLGSGVAYLLSIPVLLLAAAEWGFSSWSVTVAALLALAFNIPHYGATILRVYDQREDRRRYALFSLWATAGIVILFVLGLQYAVLGSLLITLYWSWSPWHFSGQNYGLALMFLRRRGLAVDVFTKRLLYASFVLSFALALLVVHVDSSGGQVWAEPLRTDETYEFVSLNLPLDLVRGVAPLLVLAYLGTLVAAAIRLARGRRLADLAPVGGLALTQAMWFLLPSALMIQGQKMPALIFTVTWISAAHSIQYLWVSSYFARRQQPSLRMPRYLGRSLLAGAAVTLFPAVIFAPNLLGRVPWTEGLSILLFSVVNLHHFVLDGAIWKLRDGRVARFLLRDSPPDDVAAPPGRSWLRPVLAAVGAVAVVIACVDVWEREVGILRSQDDLARIRTAADRLALIGRAAPRLHTQIAGVLAQRNELEESVREFERSLEIYPTADAWFGLGVVRAAQGHWPESRAALDEALALRPDHLNALIHSARTWMQLERPERAVEHLERARAIAPDNALIRRELEQARAAS